MVADSCLSHTHTIEATCGLVYCTARNPNDSAVVSSAWHGTHLDSSGAMNHGSNMAASTTFGKSPITVLTTSAIESWYGLSFLNSLSGWRRRDAGGGGGV